ncbi:methyl-accepting chemotaxis protein [Shewanella algae]|uniref:methyl-accepting chemotaxis protein n=1 Tax=Shewanella algae TaxID=38313 RepID=UPI001F410B6E|nr:methyl-accepting chemotaxis protein [Shewanella algae]MCE9785395.1 methyl-accepting chemotaxis protein [Shewanella algae]
MKTQSMMSLVFGAICASALLTFIFTMTESAKIVQLGDAANIRYKSYQVADELRQSSDDLTRLARTYAITGEEKYEKMYQDILDIRNGEKPRPQNYHQIYWDLVLNYGDKPKADGERAAIKNMMKSLGFSAEEFGFLDQAQANSDTLVALETKALNAVKGIFLDPASGKYNVRGEPDLVLARELLHSPAYHREKAKIMEPIDQFFSALDQRTGADFIQRMDNLKSALFWSQLLLALVILVSIVGFVMVKYKIANPIVLIYEQLTEIQKTKDLSKRIQVTASGEIAQIREQINAFISSLATSVAVTDSVSREIAKLSEEAKLAVNESRTSSQKVASELDSSASAMEEMTTTLIHVSENTQEAEARAAENESNVSLGQRTARQAQSAMSVLEQEFAKTKVAMQHLVTESDQVSNVLEVIKAIAEQTNLLALNAAIEAARAGEQGRGFAVVADEVRSLAQRTQDSTKEIDDIVASLQQRTTEVGGSVTQAAELMNKADEEFGGIISVFENILVSTEAIHSINTQVASSTEEQSLVSRDLASSITVIRDNSRNTADVIERLLNTAEYLENKAAELRMHAKEYSY